MELGDREEEEDASEGRSSSRLLRSSLLSRMALIFWKMSPPLSPPEGASWWLADGTAGSKPGAEGS